MELFSFWALADLFLPSTLPSSYHSLRHLKEPFPQGSSQPSIALNPPMKHHSGISLPIEPEPAI